MQVIDTLTSSVIDLYTNNKLSYHKIAKECHIPTTKIHDILSSNNIQIRHICRHVHIEASELDRLYNIEKLSSVDIGSRYGITSPTVLSKLRDYHIPIRENHTYTKNIVTPDTVHPSINMDSIECVNGKRYGLSTCPDCGKQRRTQIKSVHIKTNYTGLCYKCAMSRRSKNIDMTLVSQMYNQQRLTVPNIANLFGISTRRMRQKMVDFGIKTRAKGKLKTKIIKNKGTFESPVLGDICRGYDLGINDKSFYVWVSCSNCHQERWQCKNRIKKSSLCRECSMKQAGINNSGENSVQWLGGVSFDPYDSKFNERLKEQIKHRDNYTCQICGNVAQDHILSVHHIDYNKKNSVPMNLISLCISCHGLTNHNRSYWKTYLLRLTALT